MLYDPWLLYDYSFCRECRRCWTVPSGYYCNSHLLKLTYVIFANESNLDFPLQPTECINNPPTSLSKSSILYFFLWWLLLRCLDQVTSGWNTVGGASLSIMLNVVIRGTVICCPLRIRTHEQEGRRGFTRWVDFGDGPS